MECPAGPIGCQRAPAVHRGCGGDGFLPSNSGLITKQQTSARTAGGEQACHEVQDWWCWYDPLMKDPPRNQPVDKACQEEKGPRTTHKLRYTHMHTDAGASECPALKHEEWRKWESYWPQPERHTSSIRRMIKINHFTWTYSAEFLVHVILERKKNKDKIKFTPHLNCFSFQEGSCEWGGKKS